MEKKAAKMLYLQSEQQEIVTLNVGGTLFQSTKTTLQAVGPFIHFSMHTVELQT